MDPQAARKARKRINTFVLDNQQWCSKNLCYFTLAILFFFTTLFLTYQLSSLSATYDSEIAKLSAEADQLRDMVKEQMEAKKQCQQIVADVKAGCEEAKSKVSTLELTSKTKDAEISDLQRGVNNLSAKIANLKELVKNPSKCPPCNNADTPAITLVPAVPGEVNEQRRLAVKNAMKHAWDSYEKYAWGTDELKPISGTSTNWLNLGLTIVDALDTLWIMELKDEFKKGQEWVRDSLTFDKARDVSMFETVIRELGGLLSAYEFSRDKMFLTKAEDLALRLLKAFDTESGIPYASVNLLNGSARSPSWTGGASVLSEMGTVQLEFLYLAYHLNKPALAKKPMEVFRILDSLEKKDGLYPLYVHPRTGQFQGGEVSLGALGDSFYEYELKLWLLTNKGAKGYRRMFEESMGGILDKLTFKTKPSGFTYVAQIGRGGNFEHRLEHLACFTGGMAALGSVTKPEYSRSNEYMKLGQGITEICHHSYNRTATGIGPEFIEINDQNDFQVPQRGKHYLLRPETVESFFVLWRTTHDPKYREWGWQAFQAIEKHCRVEKGYSGIYDVDSTNPQYDDTMQSFFLAETLKYLYLLFSDDDVIPLDKYVFNTEAHPLGIITEPVENWPQELQFQLLMDP